MEKAEEHLINQETEGGFTMFGSDKLILLCWTLNTSDQYQHTKTIEIKVVGLFTQLEDFL